MMTPYDWQEGIGHRAQYIESRIASATPVLMVSIPDGILALTVRRQARKIFEVYDRLMMGAIGSQSDVEQVRVAALDFAHQEGFQRSEDDVTVQRVVNALSQPLKRAFADFNAPPFVVNAIFAEVSASPEGDRYMLLDYDGDFSLQRRRAYLAGTPEANARILSQFSEVDFSSATPGEARTKLEHIWAQGMDEEGRPFAEQVKDLTVEAALLRREAGADGRFELLAPTS